MRPAFPPIRRESCKKSLRWRPRLPRRHQPRRHLRPKHPRSRPPRPRRTEMSYTLNPGAPSESNIEVHKYYGGTVLLTAFLALVLQAFLHKYGRWSELVDLP